MDDLLADIQRQLKAHWGLEFGRVCRAICALDTDAFVSAEDLVTHSALSHRAVEQVLDCLQPVLQRDETAVRLDPNHRAQAQQLFALPDLPADPWEERARRHPALASLAKILSERPQPDRHLDHVAATPLTALKRALFLSTQYDLSDASLLMLGDHDMTAVALALINPDLDLAVVDIEERLLDYIDAFNEGHGASIRTYFADLRVELPASLVGKFDLVFTDPPYSESGVGLFLSRALCALNERAFARIFLSYGYGELQTSLGHKVQAALGQLRLLNEAILPRFNGYTGAPSLGRRSDLYILRPTRRSLPAALRRTGDVQIYTQGRSARETIDPALPANLIAALGDAATAWPSGDVLWVGTPLAQGPFGSALHVELGEYLQAIRAGDAAALGRRYAIINLYPHHRHYALRACLFAHAEQQLIVCSEQRSLADLFARPSEQLRLVESTFALRQRVQEGKAALVELCRRDDAPVDDTTLLLRQIIARRRARLGNAWREALIHAAAAADIALSKNGARQLIAQTRLGAEHAKSYIWEVPVTALAQLPRDAAASLQSARREGA